MDLILDKRKLFGLVQQAHEGAICLPNFQRDFVWAPDQIADLLRSMLRGYFIGSLLLLRCDKHQPPFSPALLRGALQKHVTPQPELLLLDGQQRLTSLIYALTAPDLPLKGTKLRRWFFVDLDKLASSPDDDDIVLERSLRDLGSLNSLEVQFEKKLLPCTVLMHIDGFYKWRDSFDDWLRSIHPEQESLSRSKWRPAWQKIADRFHGFEVPVVELPRVEESDPDAIGRVCAIFEKLNSTGVDLSVYDLLTARLYRTGVELHKLWDKACVDNPRLNSWSGGSADTNKFGVLVLRTLALLRGLDPKPKVLIALNPELFEDDWKRAARAMERALEIVTATHVDGFGVFHPHWLPNYGLLPILAALRAEIEIRKLGEAARAQVRHWYWCSVFLERYSSAVESKSRKDYSEFTKHWFENGPSPDIFKEARRLGSPEFSIRSSSSNASGIYCGIFCLLAKNGARDWRLGESIELQQLQDHHIFPQDYLKRNGIVVRDRINTVVNRTLIAGQTNGKIKALAPASYLSSIEIFPSGASANLLEPHFLPTGSVAAMKVAGTGLSPDEVVVSYNSFLAAREAAILTAIREACGLAVTAATLERPALAVNFVSDGPAEIGMPDEGTSVSTSKLEELSAYGQKQFRYWTDFLSVLRKSNEELAARKPKAGTSIGFPVGRGDFRLWTYALDPWIGVGMSCRPPWGKYYFNLLKAVELKIVDELSFQVDWQEHGEKSNNYVVTYAKGDPGAVNDWPLQHDWLVKRLIKFHEVFGDHVSKLPRPEGSSTGRT